MSLLSLRLKITLINILLIASVIGLAFTGYRSIDSVLALTDLDTVNKLVQKHMENDMMHDALNTDMSAAFHAVQNRDAEAIKTVAADVKDHISTLEGNLEDLNKIELPDDMRQVIAPLAGILKQYGETASQIVVTADKDIAAGTNESEALRQPFYSLFKDIEEKMGAASDLIETWSHSIKENGQNSAQKGREQLEYIAVAACILALFAATYIELALFRPQRKLLHVAEDLLHNDFSVAVPYSNRRDEIGVFSKLLEAIKSSGVEKMQVANLFESKVKSIVDVVASAATEMGATASAVADNISANSQRLSDLTQNMQRTSSNIQSVASAVGQLSASGSEIRTQVAQSTQINATAVEQSNEVNGISEELAQSIQTIGDITKMIAAITSQINLLSLNATIEAARAGEAGKGFAVVAAEVKDLANQTAKSTSDIATQVNVIQETATRALDGMKNISGVIQRIDHVSTTIASAIEEQGQATVSITRNIEEAARYSNSISDGVANVSQIAERTGNDAVEMKNASSDLARQAESLRREVDQFLNAMRKSA